MAIVCIKIGENEPFTYKKFNELSKHGDIIDLFHRKGNGQPYTSMGIKGDKEFFGLNVDLSHLSEDKIKQLKSILKRPLLSNAEQEEHKGQLQWENREKTIPMMKTIATREWYLNFTKLPFISAETLSKIEQQADVKRNIKIRLYQYMRDNHISPVYTPLDIRKQLAEKLEEYKQGFDMLSINKLDKKVNYNYFAQAVISKETNKSLKESYGDFNN